MALCVNACASNLLNHTLNSCSSTRLGDIRSIGFILCKEVFDAIAADPEDLANWELLTDPAKNPNNVNGTFINNVQVERTSEISSVERFVSDGTENQKDGTNYTITLTDQNVSCLNNAFYDSLDGQTAYISLHYNDGRMEISEMPFIINTSMPSATKNTVQTYVIEMQKKFPVGKSWICIEDAPSISAINF
jgi:hypothetical protein